MVLITLIVWALAAPPAPIKVSGARDVIEIRKLNGFVTAFSKSVTACVDAGSPIETCRCRYPQDVLNLRNGQSSCDDESSTTSAEPHCAARQALRAGGGAPCSERGRGSPRPRWFIVLLF
jgi:hypothetical protein